MFFFQAEDGVRDIGVTGVQTCALPICAVLLELVRDLRAGGGGKSHRLFHGRLCLCAPRIQGQMVLVRRSEERRVGQERRSRWSPYHLKKRQRWRASPRRPYSPFYLLSL